MSESAPVFGRDSIYLYSHIASNYAPEAPISAVALWKKFCLIGLKEYQRKISTLAITNLENLKSYYFANFYATIHSIQFIADQFFILDGQACYKIIDQEPLIIEPIPFLGGDFYLPTNNFIQNEDSFVKLYSYEGVQFYQNHFSKILFLDSDLQQKRILVCESDDREIFGKILDRGNTNFCIKFPSNLITQAAFFKDWLVFSSIFKNSSGKLDSEIYIFNISHKKFIQNIKKNSNSGFIKKILVEDYRILIWDEMHVHCYDFNFTEEELKDKLSSECLMM